MGREGKEKGHRHHTTTRTPSLVVPKEREHHTTSIDIVEADVWPLENVAHVI